MKHFKAIAAMAENRVIGRGLTLPWHLPEDFRWFKRLTTGQILVMGRRTYTAIGRPLPQRETWVLTRSPQIIPGVTMFASLDQIDPGRETRDVFICGGAHVYAQALPRCGDLFLTRLKRAVEGDVFFPPFEHLFAAVAVLEDHPEFQIVHYRNPHPLP